MKLQRNIKTMSITLIYILTKIIIVYLRLTTVQPELGDALLTYYARLIAAKPALTPKLHRSQ